MDAAGFAGPRSMRPPSPRRHAVLDHRGDNGTVNLLRSPGDGQPQSSYSTRREDDRRSIYAMSPEKRIIHAERSGYDMTPPYAQTTHSDLDVVQPASVPMEGRKSGRDRYGDSVMPARPSSQPLSSIYGFRDPYSRTLQEKQEFHQPPLSSPLSKEAGSQPLANKFELGGSGRDRDRVVEQAPSSAAPYQLTSGYYVTDSRSVTDHQRRKSQWEQGFHDTDDPQGWDAKVIEAAPFHSMAQQSINQSPPQPTVPTVSSGFSPHSQPIYRSKPFTEKNHPNELYDPARPSEPKAYYLHPSSQQPQVPATSQRRISSGDQSQRRLEESLQQRLFPGVSADFSKRPGRASPLPQAVQGAQAQPTGPRGDPSIKSEFGRMFSGLGSGLSSAPPVSTAAANGMATPSRLSPFPSRPFDGVESAPPITHFDPESVKLTRPGSLPGRKSRRVKDEDIYASTELAEGRLSTSGAASQRNSKRSKLNHPAHHHHYPPPHQ